MRHPNKEHQDSLSHNERVGVWITERVGTMICAYVFAVIGIGSLVGVVTGNAILALAFGAVSSYFLQLVLLPIIMVGTNVQSKHDKVVADIQYETVESISSKLDEIIHTLSK